MSLYVKLDDIQSMPIRLNHYDEKNGDRNFVMGIELVMKYVEHLPKYEFGSCKDCPYHGSWKRCPYFTWAGEEPPDTFYCWYATNMKEEMDCK